MHVTVLDVGEVKSVVIKDDDFAQSVKWSGASKKVELEYIFWASPWGANLGVNITVIGKDWRGNKVNISKYVEGPVGKALEMLWSLLPAWLRHGLQQLAQAVASAVNFIVEWVISKLLDLIDGFIDMVSKGLRSWYFGIINVIRGINNESSKPGYDAVYWAIKLADATFYPIKPILIGIYVTLTGIGILLTALSGGGITTIMSVIAPAIIMKIAGTAVQIGIPQFDLSKSLQYVINSFFYETTGINLTTEKNKTYFNRLYTVVIGGVLAVVSTLLLGISADKALASSTEKFWKAVGFAAGLIGTLFSWGSLILACVASYENLKEHEPITANTYDNWSMYIGILGVIFSVISLVGLHSIMDILAVVLNIILAILGILITEGVISLSS